jgi:hypothetical protein
MATSQKVYQMLGNESLWEVAVRCHELFQQAEILREALASIAPQDIPGTCALCSVGSVRTLAF